MTLERIKEIKASDWTEKEISPEIAKFMQEDSKFKTIMRNKAEETEKGGVGFVTLPEAIELAFNYLSNPDAFKDVAVKEDTSDKVKETKAKPKKASKKVSDTKKDIFDLGL